MDFLNSLEKYRGTKNNYNLTSMKGGCWFIPDNDYINFLENYEQAINKNEILSLVEKSRPITSIKYDLDFKLKSGDKRLFKLQDIKEFIGIINNL